MEVRSVYLTCVSSTWHLAALQPRFPGSPRVQCHQDTLADGSPLALGRAILKDTRVPGPCMVVEGQGCPVRPWMSPGVRVNPGSQCHKASLGDGSHPTISKLHTAYSRITLESPPRIPSDSGSPRSSCHFRPTWVY